MATWEDGPEYAPVERPAEFQAPEVAPLDDAPTRDDSALDAPVERPELRTPHQPVAALATLDLDRPAERRNPEQPFSVVRAIMTDDSSAWTAAHSTGSLITTPVSQTWAPPTGTPAAEAAGSGQAPLDRLGSGQRTILRPSPSQPINLSGQHSPSSDSPAAAGTDQWSGPGAGTPAQPAEPITLKGFLSAITPYVAIALLIGGLIAAISPLVFIVAFALSSRIAVAGVGIRRTFIAASVLLALVAIVLIFTGTDLGEWWSTLGLVSVVTCWVVLLTSAILVLRALQSGVRPPSASASHDPWGQRPSWG